MLLCFQTRKLHRSTCSHVFSPISAHFYPPLHHNGVRNRSRVRTRATPTVPGYLYIYATGALIVYSRGSHICDKRRVSYSITIKEYACQINYVTKAQDGSLPLHAAERKLKDRGTMDQQIIHHGSTDYPPRSRWG